MNQDNSGKLFLVATPIGNLGDITLRALEILKSVDLILCEDTRHSFILFKKYGINKPLLSFHEHNEKNRLPGVLKRLEAGERIAVVSDAGTPLISDPGFPLVRRALEAGIEVHGLPGPCAAINALVQSGLPSDRFYFAGFLPPKSSRRIRAFQDLAGLGATLIFYESPHRVRKFLKEAFQVLGDRQAVLVREMTKKYEETVRGTLGVLGESMLPRSWKGEFVVVIQGKI